MTFTPTVKSSPLFSDSAAKLHSACRGRAPPNTYLAHAYLELCSWYLMEKIIIILIYSLLINRSLHFRPLGNYFPACVDIVSVSPHPNSILAPIGSYGHRTVYVVWVTFSKPIKHYMKDSSMFMLTPMFATEYRHNVTPRYVHSWHGSERKYALLFYVDQLALGTP